MDVSIVTEAVFDIALRHSERLGAGAGVVIAGKGNKRAFELKVTFVDRDGTFGRVWPIGFQFSKGGGAGGENWGGLAECGKCCREQDGAEEEI